MGPCEACREALPDGARFCPACGAPVGLTITPGAERRQLTVAFCDLVGSTELSSRMDAEEFGELIQAYHERAVAVARTHGGDVEGYQGDGIVFRFGWPEAHDDDPERAVRASLEIVGAVPGIARQLAGDGPDIAVRIGIHTGPVVVGEMGSAGRPGTMALGETMNLAARLQAVATPGSVAISAATFSLVGGIFVTEPLGEHLLRGIANPVTAYRVVQPSGARGRLDIARNRLTPFVGRAAEVATLTGLWDRVLEGRGAVVLVTGEAGIGKSRLAYQLRQHLIHVPHTWFECRCSSYTQGSVLHPARDLVEQGVRILTDDPPATRLDKLRHGLALAGIRGDEATGLMASLLAIPTTAGPEALAMSPDRRRQRTIEILTRWVLAQTRLQPVVLVVEDLHWSDQSTRELLGALVQGVTGAPILLALTARPGFDSPWIQDDGITSIELAPIGELEVRAIAGSLAGGRELPEPVLARIVDETGGNPLYAEEVGRMVLESGALVPQEERWVMTAPLGGLEIPPTLRGSLTARLDRLGPAKTVGQTASVIGREFDLELLAAISSQSREELIEAMDHLVAADLVYEAGTPPGVTYVFKHALVQEAAYESLLRRTRRSVHGRIAGELARRLEGAAPIAPEIVARHFDAAGLADPAARYYHRAADDAAVRAGFQEAIAHLRRGIEVLGTVDSHPERDEREIEMQLALGSAIIAARSYSDAGIESAYRRALELCERLGDDERVAHALAGLSIFYTNRGQIELGAELGERVLAVGVARSDDTLELLGRVQLAHPRQYQCRTSETLAHARRALEIYEPARHRGIAMRFGTDHGVAAHMFAGWGLAVTGYLDQAIAHLDDAVALAQQLGQPFDLAYALFFKSTIHWAREDSEELERAAAAARAVGEEHQLDFWTRLGTVWELSEQIIRTGDASPMPRVYEASLVSGESGNRAGSTSLLGRLAETLTATGDIDSALAMIDLGFSISAETGQPWWDAELHRLRGEALLEQRGLDAAADAERELRQARDLARSRGFALHELKASVSIARLSHRLGRSVEAADVLRPAYLRMPEGRTTGVMRSARELLESLERGVTPAPGRPQPANPSVG